MADILTEVHAMLAADATLIAEVPATRIESVQATQNTARPNIVLRQPNSRERWGAFGGDDGLHRPVVEVDVYSSVSPLQAHTIGELVRAVLQRKGPVTQVSSEVTDITIEDESLDYDDDERVFVKHYEMLATIRE